MKKRRAIKPSAFVIRPVRAVGIDAKHKITVKSTLDPNLSHRGPRAKRKRMVPATLQILDDQIWNFVKPKVVRISGRRGAAANQIKKAMKKFHHEQWKARICGLAKEQSLISVALSSCSGSTLRA